MVKQNFNSGGATVDTSRTNARCGQNDRGNPCGNAIHRVSITDKCSDERRTYPRTGHTDHTRCTGRTRRTRRTGRTGRRDAMHRVSTIFFCFPCPASFSNAVERALPLPSVRDCAFPLCELLLL
jgi:hypothetical protein